MESLIDEQKQFEEFKRTNRIREARASATKLEYDCLFSPCDKAAIKSACQNATARGIGAIVVYPSFVKQCVSCLGENPTVSLVAAISCPHGNDVTEIKAEAVKRAVKDGVDEVEAFAPVCAIKDGCFQYFKRECKKLKKAAKVRALRIVFDCAALTEKELLKACQIAADTGVNCIRLNGADVDTVAKVKSALKGKCLVKADGATELSSFVSFCNVGADFVSSRRAFEIAEFLVKEAEKG